MLCPNCKQVIQPAEIALHTVECYRNSTKCRVCGDIIQKDRKRDHIVKFKDYQVRLLSQCQSAFLQRLVELIKQDNEEEASLFFDHGCDVNMVLPEDPLGWSPLHHAARHSSLSIVIGLISRGAGINPTDTGLKTPLSVAVENGQTALARSLIEFGCDIDTRDSFQRTPLMYACKAGFKDAVELLLHYKADITVTNNLGDTCVSLAQKSGNSDIMMLLVKNGASIRPASRSRPMSVHKSQKLS